MNQGRMRMHMHMHMPTLRDGGPKQGPRWDLVGALGQSRGGAYAEIRWQGGTRTGEVSGYENGILMGEQEKKRERWRRGFRHLSVCLP